MLSEDHRVGIITAESESLSERHFNSVCWSCAEIPVAVKGMDEYPKESWQPLDDHAKKEKKVVGLVEELIRESPDVGVIVLECTVVQPYFRTIRRATGLPVYYITTLVRMVQSAYDPLEYP